ncbi:hypothetical protein JQX13_04780 [Archangium violaceum]|uniref:hypothetical protein n=1 Tax=Archangium violaceum TaxID=83451 RepID=UPI00193B5CB6|nr:hypothetical protein [Archangium violaceum]QRK09459.1 hypothetical protein JQX13_04780 [Archangium violaceum]
MTTSPFVPVDFPASGVHGVPRLPPTPEPASRFGWEVGAVASRAPLELGQFTFGPSVALRTTPAPYMFGLRAAYALSPWPSSSGVSLHRLSVQGLVGVQDSKPVSPFIEAAAGWSLVGVKFPGGTQGDPTVLSTHVSGGMVAHMDPLRLRASAFIGMDLLTADGRDRWEPMWAWSWPSGAEEQSINPSREQSAIRKWRGGRRKSPIPRRGVGGGGCTGGKQARAGFNHTARGLIAWLEPERPGHTTRGRGLAVRSQQARR